MKIFRNFLDQIKPNFEKGGKLEKLYPAYDAFETFLFVPDHTSKSGSHIHDSIDLKRTMFTVIIALLPCLLFGIWNTGNQHFLAIGIENPKLLNCILFGSSKIIPMIIVSYFVGLSIEFAFAVSRGHSVNEGYLVTGLLIPMIMPVELPLWMLAVSVAFAVVIGKEVFGGTGMNIWNPALTARAFLYFAYPTMMSGEKIWTSLGSQDAVDGYSGATALANAYNGISEKIPNIYDSFIGNIPGSAAETSSLFVLIGALYLIFTGIGSWRIIISGIFGGIFMGIIFNLFSPSLNSNNLLFSINPIHQIFLGGFLFGVVFMATDPVSASQTTMGKYIYGFLVGSLGILIRVVNPAYPEGIMMSILFMNTMAPLIDHYVISANIKRRLGRIKPQKL
ncbi:MAG: NADH:ubiquinone reductase (Na(+)-transporting) subunit B [Flavobacteriales bacterium TMED288]|nr:NADH:ubiquinone reductase (Na(+)-transporting) subunit B [Flavobacteriales bacterium]RPG53717.1 MAG: NADH:ubiquinone reductase (Na(+)-transporting) subunit B [Flavobacteriales bacterium TMED288]|tara:strand:+ start:411 stop:1586 length:1176 start_codon:yes stop_codon:yes gene_type:complete